MSLARSLAVSLTFLAAVGAPLGARAQDAPPSALARALVARYPQHEIVPQSCAPGQRPLVAGDRLCLVDVRSGLVRVVRRIALGGYVQAGMRGTDVFFAAADDGGASTRFAGRAWRWDLLGDAYLGLGNLPVDHEERVIETSFGVLYRLRSGWFVNDGGRGRQVRVPEDELDGSLHVADGRTFMVVSDAGPSVTIETIELDQDHVRRRPHATLAGSQLMADGDTVLALARSGRTVRLRVLRPPATESVEIEVPASLRTLSGASRIDARRVLLTGGRGARAVLDLETGTIDTADVPPAASTTPLLRASSLVHVQPTAEGGLYVGRAVGGWRLDASGATRIRRPHPRAAPVRCTCTETTLTCDRGAITVPDGCAEVPELDRIRDEYAETATGQRTRESLFTADGRFRIDRLEADLARVTRLTDGARLWVRMFDDALFAQVDDGGYFVSDRALVERMAIRDGRGLLTDPIAPLAPRADALYREGLVREFFAPPATASAPRP